MKNRKMLFVAGGALLALVVVGLLSVRDTGETTAILAAAPSAPSAAATNGASRILAPGVAARAMAAPAVPATQTPTRRGTLPFVLTSKAPFTKPLRLAAEALGAKTVSSVSRHSLLVEATPDARARLKADARFEDVVEFAPAEKIQPELAALVEKGEKSVEVSIVSLDAIDRETVIAALKAAGGEMLKGCINEGDTIRAKIPSDSVATLAARGEVRWMERFVRPEFTNNLAVEEPCMNVVTVWNTHGLTGAGQKISTSDSGIDSGDPATLHEDLRNRVKDMQVAEGCYTTDVNGHGTHTAGSIVGDGTKSGGQIRGTAYEADLYAWFCGGTDGHVWSPSAMEDLYLNGGAWPATIHSASWGSAVGGQYVSSCVNHDRYVWEHPEFLPVFAAGNSGCDKYGKEVYPQSINSPGSAKNVLTVGATQSTRLTGDGGWGNGDPTKTVIFSSRGPCADGRIKPDVAAPGTGILSTRSHGVDYDYGNYNEYYAYSSGTSMATPLTAGAVALVRQWLMEQKGFDGTTEVSPGVTNRLPTAALLKAVVMGGARGVAVPNNDQGWGRVDLEETLFPSGGRAVKLIDRIPFEQDFVTNIVIETTNAAPLDVQLVWVDYPGSSSGSQSMPRLVNDLDLTVEQYGGGEGLFCYGNGGDEPDTLNNVESVRIASATATKYIITVDCKTILHDHTEGGAAALYIRGAFDPAVTPETPKCVHLEKANEDFFSLDKALAAVRDDGETVKILRPTRFSKSVEIPTNCTVVAEAADPSVKPVVFCAANARLSVPENVTVEFAGVAFTNVCAGLAVDGSLKTSAGTSFASLAAVTVTSNGVATLSQTSIAGDTPMLSLASNGVVTLREFSVAGEKADWTIDGRLQLEGVQFASNQTVTVAANGSIALGAGVTNLVRVTLERATKDSLTLTGVLAEQIAVDAQGASALGKVFGSFTCDYATASETAKRLYNVQDMDLGGEAVSASGEIKWGLVSVPLVDAFCIVTTNGVDRTGYRTFSAALRAVSGTNGLIVVARDVTHTNTLTLTHDLALASVNGAQLAFGPNAGFVIPEGRCLLITNAVVRGTGDQGNAVDSQKAIGFSVTGGELILEDGAFLTGFSSRYATHRDAKDYGATVVVNPGTFTMRTGSCITNCVSHAQGGAVWLGGTKATANLLGGTISDCTASCGGAVYACSKAKVNVAGEFEASANTKSDGTTPSNLYLTPNVIFALTNALTGSVGVSFGVTTPDLNAPDANFVALACELTPQTLTNSAACFANDINTNLVGGCVEGQIVWTERPVDDGQCEEDVAGVEVSVSGEANRLFYRTLDDAFKCVSKISSDEFVFYVRPNQMLSADAAIEKSITLTCAAGSGLSTLWRTNDAMYRVSSSGSLTLTNIVLSGMVGTNSTDFAYTNRVGLVSVDGGSLTLDNGAVVGPVDGSDSRAANAISVFNGGTLTMLPGSMVKDAHNSYVDASDATGCGGGVLLDNATAYFCGGAVQDCRAYRAGGVYVANGSKAYVSGDFVATNNTELSGLTNDNFVVSANADLILAGELTGAVGVNEGIACDTNAFATVEWAWADTNVLKASAARFVHDRRGAHGVAVTNASGDVALVWDDTLTPAGRFAIDGEVYQIFLAPGQTVAVPTAFSLGTTFDGSGKMALSLDGGVAGCWYTVYSTDDLAQPFIKEASVQLKAGETFSYEIDRAKAAKFYKVEAEEGLR